VREQFRAQLWQHYQYDELVRGSDADVWPFYDGNQMAARLDELGLLRRGQLGNAALLCLDLASMAQATLRELEANPAVWFKGRALEWLEATARASTAADDRPAASPPS